MEDPMSTASDIEQAIQGVESLVDIALPAMGHGELVPIADALARVAGKVTEAIASRLSAAPTLQAEIAAADAAFEAEKAKLPR
jgi:hypothetical protein